MKKKGSVLNHILHADVRDEKMTSDYDVAIIGAGAAGIAAARELVNAGLTVIILEASDRVGGRAWTVDLREMPLDMGCGWLHSAQRNPLVAVGLKCGLTIERGESAWQSQWRDLRFSKDEQSSAKSAWDGFQQRLRHQPSMTDRASDVLKDGDRWNSYCQALSGYLNGAQLERLSVRDFLAYDNAATEDNWRVREGYGRLIASCIPETARIRLSTPVRRVSLVSNGVHLETNRGRLSADAAILTVSTNALARGCIAFDPIVDEHLFAAGQLPLGLADKLFLELCGDHGLEPETHLLGNPYCASTGSYYIRPLGRPIIEGFYGGIGAVRIEKAGVMDAFAFAIDELASLIGNRIRPHLRPLIATNWCSMDWIHGSYSHALPRQAHARELLARPIAGRLFFAGEATHLDDFSTAHGAWESGVRAAGEVLSVRTPREGHCV
ncbi:monoamine oxidase [Rhizobium sp. BE258]|nr:monoamine oxidase [Rhizobium sp. BE258]